MNVLDETLDYLPQYAQDYSRGLLVAILGDPTVTSLAIGASAKNKSVRRFFLGYAAARTVNSIANAIGNGLLAVGQAYVASNRAREVEPVT